jgi:23S rRNA pseudouridine1911/1915/1917 synthase
MSPAGSRRIHLELTDADAGARLDQVLTSRVPALSRAQAQRLIRDGHVRLSEGRVKPALAVWPGLEVDVEIPAVAPATPAAEALPLAVLYDDEDVAVVDKPAGMVVHPAAGHAAGTLVNALLHHLRGLSGIGGAERPGIVHRLDRGTSGVMVVAKTDEAHRALSRQFQERHVGKEYLVLAWGTLRPGETLSRPIGRDPRHRQKMSSRARRTRSAVTRVVSAEPLGGVSFAKVTIGTGRTHQIRVHLSSIGHPLLGDATYGKRGGVPFPRHALHAERLTLVHPRSGKTAEWHVDPPADLQELIAALRREDAGARPESRVTSHGSRRTK